jgi:hypothetical protein
MTLGGFNGTNFNVLTQDPSAFLASFNGGNSVMGTVNFTQVQNANTEAPTLIGGYTVTAVSGNPAFVSNFGGVGGTGTFDWPLNPSIFTNFTTLAGLLTQTGSPANFSNNSVFFLRDTGSITPVGAPSEIPLPPAIYLFGTVLGGAFWLGRRRRSAPSGLASA